MVSISGQSDANKIAEAAPAHPAAREPPAPKAMPGSGPYAAAAQQNTISPSSSYGPIGDRRPPDREPRDSDTQTEPSRRSFTKVMITMFNELRKMLIRTRRSRDDNTEALQQLTGALEAVRDAELSPLVPFEVPPSEPDTLLQFASPQLPQCEEEAQKPEQHA